MNDKPKSLRYASGVEDVEGRIIDALPRIIDGLIARAGDGDTRAAIYLCDRIMGRAVGARTAPADDREPPFSEEAFLRAAKELGTEQARPRIVIAYRDERRRPDGEDPRAY